MTEFRQKQTNHNGSGSDQSVELPRNEADAVASFVDVVNNVMRGNENPNPITEQTALKFLISSKFDLERALELYRSHEITRFREGLSELDPSDENLRRELESGKFTILDRLDSSGNWASAIAIFTARLHTPTKGLGRNSNESRRLLHRYTLQGIVYQLDAALDDIKTQRNGFEFIYNMCDSDYSNFDYELCQKILNLLKGAYPAKLKKVLIVSPPLWFRAPFHVLRLFVGEKLRERVLPISRDQLPAHIPSEILTPELGGTLNHDHLAWLRRCRQIHDAKHNDLCDPVAARHIAGAFSQSTDFRRLSQERLGELSPTHTNNAVSPGYYVGNNNHGLLITPASTMSIKTTPYQEDPSLASVMAAYSQGAGLGAQEYGVEAVETEYDYDDASGICLVELHKIYKQKSKDGLAAEYEGVKEKWRRGSTKVAEIYQNMRKNRYSNILPYDHTRVVLKRDDLPGELESLPDPCDYINACYIDGYHQRKAYISTQGPMDSTCMDFWRMIWQTQSRVIAMFAQCFENGYSKCHQYWPLASEPCLIEGIYKIENEDVIAFEDFTVTRLRLTNSKLGDESRIIWHLQYTSWPDFGTPASAEAILKFRDFALKKQLDAIEQCGHLTYPPFVVHCSAGVGRTGTFITIDISIKKLETTGLVDIASVVDKLRCQRKDSVQTADQYIFCYKAVLEYADSCNLFQSGDLIDN